MSGCKTFVSEVGNPRHASGEGNLGRNWSCGCKPGILGPPVSPLPPMLRATVEAFTYGPPSSWKLCATRKATNLDLTWKMNTAQSTNPFVLFPPPLMTVIATLPNSPDEWSITHNPDSLRCSLSWSEDVPVTKPDAPTSPVAPSTTSDSSSCSTLLNPSASPFQSSPLSLLQTSTPVECELQPSKLSKPTMDADTQTPVPPKLSSTTSDSGICSPLLTPRVSPAESSSPTLLQASPTSPIPFILPSSSDQGSQTSPENSKTNTDAATSTTTPTLTSVTCQTVPPRSLPLNAGVQTSTTTSTSIHTQTPTSAQPSQAAVPKAKKNKKSPKSKTPIFIAQAPAAPPKPTTAEAATSYETPNAGPAPDSDRWCKKCRMPIRENDSPISHLTHCGAMPEEMLEDLDIAYDYYANMTDIPTDTLRATHELLMSTRDPINPIPPATDNQISSFMKLIMPDPAFYKEFRTECENIIDQIISYAQTKFNFSSPHDLANIFTDTQPTFPRDKTLDRPATWTRISSKPMFRTYLGLDDEDPRLYTDDDDAYVDDYGVGEDEYDVFDEY